MLVLTTGKGEAPGQDLMLEKSWRRAQLFRVLLISMVGKCQKQFSESQIPAARFPDLPYLPSNTTLPVGLSPGLLAVIPLRSDGLCGVSICLAAGGPQHHGGRAGPICSPQQPPC